MSDLVRRVGEIFEESMAIQRAVLEQQAASVAAIAEAVAGSIASGGKILLCGNGGSAADAQHLAAEFVVRLHPRFNRRSLPALALGGDTPLLTAAANDLGFEDVFARQVEALGASEDVLIALSTSGRSANVVRALDRGRRGGLRTVGLLGGDGGDALALADLAVTVRSDDPGRVQETHILVGHAVVELAETLLVDSGHLAR